MGRSNRGGGAPRCVGALLAGCVLVIAITSCGSQSEQDRAVDVLVEARGMDPAVARCTVVRLDQLGVPLDDLGDGRVDAVENREIVEVVTTCAVGLASVSADAAPTS